MFLSACRELSLKISLSHSFLVLGLFLKIIIIFIISFSLLRLYPGFTVSLKSIAKVLITSAKVGFHPQVTLKYETCSQAHLLGRNVLQNISFHSLNDCKFVTS